jgi:hypothetical protein
MMMMKKSNLSHHYQIIILNKFSLNDQTITIELLLVMQFIFGITYY